LKLVFGPWVQGIARWDKTWRLSQGKETGLAGDDLRRDAKLVS